MTCFFPILIYYHPLSQLDLVFTTCSIRFVFLSLFSWSFLWWQQCRICISVHGQQFVKTAWELEFEESIQEEVFNTYNPPFLNLTWFKLNWKTYCILLYSRIKFFILILPHNLVYSPVPGRIMWLCHSSFNFISTTFSNNAGNWLVVMNWGICILPWSWWNKKKWSRIFNLSLPSCKNCYNQICSNYTLNMKIKSFSHKSILGVVIL